MRRILVVSRTGEPGGGLVNLIALMFPECEVQVQEDLACVPGADIRGRCLSGLTSGTRAQEWPMGLPAIEA